MPEIFDEAEAKRRKKMQDEVMVGMLNDPATPSSTLVRDNSVATPTTVNASRTNPELGGTMGTGNTFVPTVPLPQPEPPAAEPPAPTGLAPVTDQTARPEDDNVWGTALQRALQMMLTDDPTTDAERNATRQLGQSATAQEVGDFNARLAAGGMGASGLGASVGADISRRGALETQRAVSDLERAGRDEQLQTILAGAGLAGQAGRDEGDAVTRSILQDLLQSEAGGDETTFDNVASDAAAADETGFRQGVLDKAREDAASFSNSGLAEVGDFFGGLIGTDTVHGMPEFSPADDMEGWGIQREHTDDQGVSWIVYQKTIRDPATGDKQTHYRKVRL